MAKKKPTTPQLTDAARRLGTAGGQAGGPARAEALTAAQRQEIARQGGNARHGKGEKK